jgi:hypothetical protein
MVRAATAIINRGNVQFETQARREDVVLTWENWLQEELLTWPWGLGFGYGDH